MAKRLLLIGTVAILATVVASVAVAQQKVDLEFWVGASVSEAGPPPEWALWERQLLDRLYPAALEFVRRYMREDGTLIWRDQWPGMDGSDDGYESFYNFPLYYALGGPEELNALSRRLWDAVTKQFTQYGLVHHEFDAYYDWMHHGESNLYIYYFGLADPTVAADPDGPVGRAYVDAARRTAARLSVAGVAAAPSITVEDT